MDSECENIVGSIIKIVWGVINVDSTDAYPFFTVLQIVCCDRMYEGILSFEVFFLGRATGSALMKCIIKSLIYVSTTNIYWNILATCFDLVA